MKNLKTLGKILNKNQQKTISGGEFCAIHCLSECYDNHAHGSQGLTNCGNECQRIANSLGSSF